MWFNQSVFYQIFPLGFSGAPSENDGILVNRLEKVTSWIPHLTNIGVTALYFCPVFESDTHGYDTRNYKTIDCRLGTNESFAKICAALHASGIKVVLDGVFNHVGRGFWAFQDLMQNKQSSPYKDWFHINFSGNSAYNDGFGYEGWEGHFNLVKLNLQNQQVVQHLFECIRGWVQEFDIDGLRLDVAYMLDKNFLRQLSGFCKTLKPEFFLIGEAIHGDYNQLVNSEMLQSCTNYECFKGIFSSLNDYNMFEIAYSLNRQFGAEQWTLYKGLPLFNFVDNHDVNRLASNLHQPMHIKAAYTLLFTTPGIPCIYYGSEWGATGEKTQGSDAPLRPSFDAPIENELTDYIAALSKIKKSCSALHQGGYAQLYLTNKQFIFSRNAPGDELMIAINIDSVQHIANLPINGNMQNLFTGEDLFYGDHIELPAFSSVIYKRI